MLEVVEALLLAGADPNAVGHLDNTPAHLAATANSPMVRLCRIVSARTRKRRSRPGLLAKAAARTLHARCPAHHSSTRRRSLPARAAPQALKLLIMHGAIVTRRNRYGQLPSALMSSEACRKIITSLTRDGDLLRVCLRDEFDAARRGAERAAAGAMAATAAACDATRVSAQLFARAT